LQAIRISLVSLVVVVCTVANSVPNSRRRRCRCRVQRETRLSSFHSLRLMRFALYVSGHGYGHCTRASALVESLLAAQHEVTIVTNALPFPFSAVLPPADASAASTAAQGPYATYRYAILSYCTVGTQLTAASLARHALVDAGIVQPKAYDVDRQATLGKLQVFLTSREERIGEEVAWLTESRTEVVLSDATFLGW
jgi:hypothetical protein